jgi:integrase
VTRIKLKFVDCFTDRHGHVRYYFRRGRGARIALPGAPGLADFMRAYEAALAGDQESQAATPPKRRGAPGTFDALLQAYFESVAYRRLSATTRHAYQLRAEQLVREEGIGGRLVAQMKRQHVERMLGKRSAAPAAANNALRVLRLLVNYSIDLGWRTDNPTARVKLFTVGEHHSWTDEEIAAFEARWPIGTRERVVFALLLHTGQRLDDVRTMSWAHLEGGGVHVRQGKTKARLWVPMHPELAAVLEQRPRTHHAIITTHRGEPFTQKGFGTWLASRIERAGLPERCVPHGLRKAAARRLADAGCSAHEIMAITGHKSLAEVQRYTRAAEQRRLAQAAMDRLANKDSQP